MEVPQMRFACCSVVFFIVALLFLSGSARAENPYRMEAFGSVGSASEFEIFSQTHLNVGGGFGFRPFPKGHSRLLRMLGGEFEANTTSTPNWRFSVFTANLVVHASLGAT